jgi:hypothetical protein
MPESGSKEVASADWEEKFGHGRRKSECQHPAILRPKAAGCLSIASPFTL